MGADDLFPLADPVGFLFGQQDQAEFVFDFFQQDRDLIAGDRGNFPLVDWHDPFALIANVDQNFFAINANDRSYQNRVDVITIIATVIEMVQAPFFEVLGLGQRDVSCQLEFFVADVKFT